MRNPCFTGKVSVPSLSHAPGVRRKGWGNGRIPLACNVAEGNGRRERGAFQCMVPAAPEESGKAVFERLPIGDLFRNCASSASEEEEKGDAGREKRKAQGVEGIADKIPCISIFFIVRSQNDLCAAFGIGISHIHFLFPCSNLPVDETGIVARMVEGGTEILLILTGSHGHKASKGSVPVSYLLWIDDIGRRRDVLMEGEEAGRVLPGKRYLSHIHSSAVGSFFCKKEYRAIFVGFIGDAIHTDLRKGQEGKEGIFQ